MSFLKGLSDDWEIVKKIWDALKRLPLEKKIIVFCLFFTCLVSLCFLAREGFLGKELENNICRIEHYIKSHICQNGLPDEDTSICGDKAISTGFTKEKARKAALLDAENNLLNKFTEAQKSKVRQYMTLCIDTTYSETTYTAEARYMVEDRYCNSEKIDVPNSHNTIIYICGDKAISTGFTKEKARKAALLDAENNLLNKFTEAQKSKVRQYMTLSIDTTYKNIRGTYTAEARYMVEDRYCNSEKIDVPNSHNTIIYIYGDKAISTGFTKEKARKAALLDAENNLLNKFTEAQKSKVRQYMTLCIDTTYSKTTYTAEASYEIDNKYLKDK